MKVSLSRPEVFDLQRPGRQVEASWLSGNRKVRMSAKQLSMWLECIFAKFEKLIHLALHIHAYTINVAMFLIISWLFCVVSWIISFWYWDTSMSRYFMMMWDDMGDRIHIACPRYGPGILGPTWRKYSTALLCFDVGLAAEHQERERTLWGGVRPAKCSHPNISSCVRFLRFHSECGSSQLATIASNEGCLGNQQLIPGQHGYGCYPLSQHFSLGSMTR